MLKQALSLGQLDVSNLVFAELAFRRMQVIEYSYIDKVKEQEASGAGPRLSMEEQSAFVGVAKLNTLLIV